MCKPKRNSLNGICSVSLCREPPRAALVDPFLDAIDEGVDQVWLHFPAELAASLDRGLDVFPFHHPRQSRLPLIHKLDMIWLRFSQ